MTEPKWCEACRAWVTPEKRPVEVASAFGERDSPPLVDTCPYAPAGDWSHLLFDEPLRGLGSEPA